MASLRETRSSHSSHSMRNTNGSFCQYKERGRPPWLKGKEIGLYYRDKARAKAKAKSRDNVKNVIRLRKEIRYRIKDIVVNSCNAHNRDSAMKNRYKYIDDHEFNKAFLNKISGNLEENIAKALRNGSNLKRDEDIDDMLLEEYKAKQHCEKYNKMMKWRHQLPCYKMKAEILDSIRNNQIVVISGETGCGKSTQICQYILDDQIQQRKASTTCIVCTQPRRISTISVAERVADERAERVGKSVGYKIRLEKSLPRDRGSILFCTTGMLLQLLQQDPALNDFSHIILDEIHERSTESDFILALLKFIIPQRPDLKVVLMSATVNSQAFAEYYNHCSMIHVPGFTYPVQEYYLEDVLKFTGFTFPIDFEKLKMRRYNVPKRTKDDEIRISYANKLKEEKKYSLSVTDALSSEQSEILSFDLLREIIVYICNTQDPGAILVFLPGVMDIVKLQKDLTMCFAKDEDKYIIHGLYSQMSTSNQRSIFKEPPEGVRKIILATNIAEASITIEDVVYVVDSGKIKYRKFDLHMNIHVLRSEWVSLANAKQRRGRAGRVKPGICYHLYTRGRQETFREYPVPEILTTSLESIILQMKSLQLGKVEPFLLNVMDPPEPKAIHCSLQLLRSLNALDDEEFLTPLGYHLTKLSIEPRAGKMIIWAALFSCLEPVLAIAASLSFKDPFIIPLIGQDRAKERKCELNREEFSDHIALAEAVKRFEMCRKKNRACAHQFCHHYYLSYSTLEMLSEIKVQLASKLYEMKFIESANPSDKNANRNSDNTALIKALLCVGLYPNIAHSPTVKKGGVTAVTQDAPTMTLDDTPMILDAAVHATVHPSSVNAQITNVPSSLIAYFFKQQSTATFLHDTTFLSKGILLFITNDIHANFDIGNSRKRTCLKVGNFVNFECHSLDAWLILELQSKLNDVVERKLRHPGVVLWNSYEGDMLNLIIDLISLKDEEIEIKVL